jgi:hypothetical protein
MATLINVDEFRERFDIDMGIANPRIEPHIGSASRRLRGWVGASVYDALLAATDPDEQVQPGRDLDSAIVNDLKNAEAHLTMHYAILGMHFVIRSKGITATETASEGHEVRRYLSPKETQELSTMYLELAREIAEPYATSDGTPGAGFEFVTVDGDCCLPDTSCEGVTRRVC